MTAVYLVTARKAESCMNMGMRTATEALTCAHDFQRFGRTVSIMDADGIIYSVEQFSTLMRTATPGGADSSPV